MPAVIVTLGRLPKALELCRGFAALGWRVVVAEPHARHLCGASRHVARSVALPPPAAGKRAYLEALARVVEEEGAGLVVPVSEEALHVAHLPPFVPPSVRVLAMPPAAMLALHDKGEFVAIARAAGVAVPQTHPLGSAAGAALARERRVVVKPVHSCAGRGVRVLDPGAALPAPDPAAPAVVQDFVPGEEVSSCALADRGRVVANVIYRGVQFGGSVAVAFERIAHPAAEAWIAKLVAALGWSGFISFDLRVTPPGEVFGIECNPRTTSGLHFLDAAGVAAAILDPRRAVPLRPQARLQQAWSCLTETQLGLLRLRRGALGDLRRLLTTRDCCWDARDPWPLLSMPATAWPILREAARRRVPFGEVATLDVGWFEGETNPAALAPAGRATATATASPAPPGLAAGLSPRRGGGGG